MDRLYEKGYITNPHDNQEFVRLTEDGLTLAKQLATNCFDV